MENEAQTIPPYCIASAIPGRVRVQFARRFALKGMLDAYARRLSSVRSVFHTRVAEDAASVVVTYDRRKQGLDSFLDCVQTLTWESLREWSRVPAVTRLARSPGGFREDADPKRIESRMSGNTAVRVLQEIPGRLRVHVPLLDNHRETAARLESELAAKEGIRQVHLQRENCVLAVRYNKVRYQPAAILRTVRRVLRLMFQSPPGHREEERVGDLTEKQGPGLHPLLLPSAAAALALTGLAPAAVTLGVLALAALPILARALQGVLRRRPNVDQLDLAALAALAVLGDLFTGSLLIWLVGLGDTIRAMTMRRSRRAISELLSPAGQQAWIERDGVILSMSVQELASGDIVVIYPGDQIPADGVITRGQALVDMKILTGESAPILKHPGDAVFALTTVLDGQIAVRVEHIGRATRAGQVAALIEGAPLSDTRIQNYATLVGDRLVLPLFALAGLIYLCTGDLFRMAAVLILDFATGIRVAAPTTILSAMTGAARQGLFIKGGKAVERLAKVNAIVFDKTGTLTCGEPFITEIHALTRAYSQTDVLRLAASAEANLKHPSAKAVVEAARDRGIHAAPCREMEYTLGKGVKAVIEGKVVCVGSERYMQEMGIPAQEGAEAAVRHSLAGDSLVYIAAEGVLIGMLGYADPPRNESRLVLEALRERRVQRIVMLTGDNARAAHAAAEELGISEVISDAFPEQKADVVRALRAEGYVVAVIGDGVNDSPAFARADVGISLAHGADVAKETADVILLDGDLWGLPRALDLARAAMGTLNQNLNIIMGPTAAGLLASVFGLTTPLIATLIGNGTTIVAGLNALRPLGHRGRSDLPESGRLLSEETLT